MRTEPTFSTGRDAWSRARACPRGAGDRGGARARDPGHRRARARLAALPNRFVAVTGTNGKTTTAELIGHLLREPGSRSRWPATSARRLPRWWASRRERRSSAKLELPARGLRGFAPECAVFLNLAPDHLDRHGTIEDYLDGEAPHLRQPGRRRRRDRQRRRAGTGRARARGEASWSASDRGAARREFSLRGRRDPLARRAADPTPTSCGCSAATTSPTRWPPPLRRSRSGSRGDAVARGAAQLRGRPAPARAGRRARRRPLRQRLEGDQRLRGGRGARAPSRAASA